MNIVPLNKHDLETCSDLSKANDSLVIDNLSELLEWLQDMNWPVAPKVIDRVCKIGMPLESHLAAILTGTDSVWKYWIISNLCPRLKVEVKNSIKGLIETIANNPTSSEKLEEVDIVALELIGKW